MTIRAARPSERGVLRALLIEATAALGYPDAVMAQIRRHVEHDPALAAEAIAAGRVLVAELHAEIAGFAAIEPPGADCRSELSGLFVAPRRWRRGVGTRLVAAASERAAGLGARTLWVVGNSPFYARTGWRIVAETDTPLGERAWIMERRIGRGPVGGC